MQFCYALRSFGHINYVCDLRQQYCTKSEKGILLKLYIVSEVHVFIFRKKKLKEKQFFRQADPNVFFWGSPETQVFFLALPKWTETVWNKIKFEKLHATHLSLRVSLHVHDCAYLRNRPLYCLLKILDEELNKNVGMCLIAKIMVSWHSISF